MHYMSAHGTKRSRPNELIPGTVSIISLRMNYLDTDSAHPIEQLHANNQAYVSRYALGRDYHKVIRAQLKKMIDWIQTEQPDAACRGFVDSAPVLERPIAEQSGLGFIGKNSLIIHPRAGSWFFLAEIYTNLQLEVDSPFEKQGCGPCRACIIECPTQAIIADGIVDARRCISYLTIENKGGIPIEFRHAIGNRIYGCDDCQLVCPWNHFTQPNQQADFKARHELDNATLIELFNWTELQFNQKMEGSPIRRIGYANWIRNLAIAIGNSDGDVDKIDLLRQKKGAFGALIDEHLEWAIEQQNIKIQQVKVASKATGLQQPVNAKKYYLPKGWGAPADN